MYTDQYLAITAQKRVTPGTFLSGVLRGKAKKYASKYKVALVNDLTSRKDVKPVRSIGGCVAYVKI